MGSYGIHVSGMVATFLSIIQRGNWLQYELLQEQ